MTVSAQELERLVCLNRKIKAEYVDTRLQFYKDRVDSKRIWAQRASIAVLSLSLVIPIVANLPIIDIEKNVVVSLLSVSIAFISGLGQIHRWQETWKEYSAAIVRIEAAIAAWELRIADASMLADSAKPAQALAAATEKLVQSVTGVVSAEMQRFFPSGESGGRR